MIAESRKLIKRICNQAFRDEIDGSTALRQIYAIADDNTRWEEYDDEEEYEEDEDDEDEDEDDEDEGGGLLDAILEFIPGGDE